MFFNKKKDEIKSNRLYIIHYEIEYFMDAYPTRSQTFKKTFQYDDINEAYHDMKSLWNRDKFTRKIPSLLKKRSSSSALIEGFFESRIRYENTLFRNIWMEVK